MTDDLLAHLAKATKRDVEPEPFGPDGGGFALARIDGWPKGASSWVTVGLSQFPYTLFRGDDVGRELVLTLPDGTSDEERDAALETLRATVLEDARRHRDKDRRPAVEANGVSAPGYPPHLVFVDELVPPALRKRAKLDELYVTFTAAVPIDDAQLREYDRDAAALVARLSGQNAQNA